MIHRLQTRGLLCINSTDNISAV